MSSNRTVFDPKEKLQEIENRLNVLIPQLIDLIKASSPELLLGTAYVSLYGELRSATAESEMSYSSQVVLRLLEYAHGVYASTAKNAAARQLSTSEYQQLDELVRRLYDDTLFFVTFSTKGAKDFAGGDSSEIEYWAGSNWLSIRRYRYPEHDIPFLRLMLEPHCQALERAYGISLEQLLNGIERIAYGLYRALPDRLSKARSLWIACHREAKRSGKPFEVIVETYLSDETQPAEKREALRALWLPDYLNVSTATGWPAALMDDLAWSRGEATQLLDGSARHGWLTNTLPVRRKPFVYLDSGAYAFETTFAFEAVYRAIQWGVIARLPDYRQEWNTGQNLVSESAFQRVLSKQLAHANVYPGVRYQMANGNWAECDTVIVLDDVLLVVEAKAGVYGLASPMEEMEKHLAALKRLMLDAYQQAKRFIEHLQNVGQAPIFQFVDGKYIRVADVRFSDFRVVLPIGLSVENLAPFPGLLKQLPNTGPILRKHPFVALAIDDLFPLSELLQTTSEFIHYLEVRQAAGLHPRLSLHDEMDHLGAYIQKNRFDDLAREYADLDIVQIGGMSDIIDRYYYERANAEPDALQRVQVPAQEYPREIRKVLVYLDAKRPRGWLEASSWLRNASGGMRRSLDQRLTEGIRAVMTGRTPAFHLPGNEGISVIMGGPLVTLEQAFIRDYGAVACHAFGKGRHNVLVLTYQANGEIIEVTLLKVSPPSVLQANYADLVERAAVLKERPSESLTMLDEQQAAGPNSPCPCGSGRKFKRCHGVRQ